VKAEQALAEVELKFKDRRVKLKALVDTGASRSVISKRLADYLGAFTPLEKPYELRTADRGGRLKVVGYCNVDVVFEGVEVPGGARFEVAENLRDDVDLIIGRPEMDAWEITFTPEGPRPRKVPHRVRGDLVDQTTSARSDAQAVHTSFCPLDRKGVRAL
jgi:predicted aspartyl protease